MEIQTVNQEATQSNTELIEVNKQQEETNNLKRKIDQISPNVEEKNKKRYFELIKEFDDDEYKIVLKEINYNNSKAGLFCIEINNLNFFNVDWKFNYLGVPITTQIYEYYFKLIDDDNFQSFGLEISIYYETIKRILTNYENDYENKICDIESFSVLLNNFGKLLKEEMKEDFPVEKFENIKKLAEINGKIIRLKIHELIFNPKTSQLILITDYNKVAFDFVKSMSNKDISQRIGMQGEEIDITFGGSVWEQEYDDFPRNYHFDIFNRDHHFYEINTSNTTNTKIDKQDLIGNTLLHYLYYNGKIKIAENYVKSGLYNENILNNFGLKYNQFTEDIYTTREFLLKLYDNKSKYIKNIRNTNILFENAHRTDVNLNISINSKDSHILQKLLGFTFSEFSEKLLFITIIPEKDELNEIEIDFDLDEEEQEEQEIFKKIAIIKNRNYKKNSILETFKEDDEKYHKITIKNNSDFYFKNQTKIIVIPENLTIEEIRIIKEKTDYFIYNEEKQLKAKVNMHKLEFECIIKNIMVGFIHQYDDLYTFSTSYQSSVNKHRAFIEILKTKDLSKLKNEYDKILSDNKNKIMNNLLEISRNYGLLLKENEDLYKICKDLHDNFDVYNEINDLKNDNESLIHFLNESLINLIENNFKQREKETQTFNLNSMNELDDKEIIKFKETLFKTIRKVFNKNNIFTHNNVSFVDYISNLKEIIIDYANFAGECLKLIDFNNEIYKNIDVDGFYKFTDQKKIERCFRSTYVDIAFD